MSYYAPGGARSTTVIRDGATTIQEAAGTFLRAFLAFGFIAMWARWVDAMARRRRMLFCFGATLLCIAAQALSNLSFNYNRAAMVYPAIAILAAFSVTVRRVSGRVLLPLAVAAAVVLPLFGTYRARGYSLLDVVQRSEIREDLLNKTDINSAIQVYGGGPQLTAYLLDGSGWASTLYWGKTLVASALYPVPILGAPFRESSGVTLFNRLIYGNEILDQVIPFTGELFLNFHVIGVIGGYALLGWAIAVLHDRFSRSKQSLEAYMYFFVALWLSSLVISSIAAVSQIFIYMMWPLYGYILIRGISRRRKHGFAGMGRHWRSHLEPADRGFGRCLSSPK